MTKRQLWVIGLGSLAALLLPIAAIRLHVHFEKRRVLRMNHEAILSACRFMMTNRDKYQGEIIRKSPRSIALDENWRSWTEMPDAIRALHPRYVVISEDEVFICLHVIPRVYLRAYAEGAEGQGTVKLIDGLWFWNGVPAENG